MSLDHTHDPARRSWVRTANGHSEFPIQNLPYGVFRRRGNAHIGVAIGDHILDLTALEQDARFTASDVPVFGGGTLNALMSCGPDVWHQTRYAVSDLLKEGATPLSAQFLVPQSDVSMELPLFVRSFTDFYASRAHATNVGALFRDPERALMPNWLHLPVGYNGRASGVVVSGTDVVRPVGQRLLPGAESPVFAAEQRLDFEVELGAVIGAETQISQRLTPSEADMAIFGYVLLNDWSARDIQVWEYQPLGPFLSKAFATSVSPWIVTSEALKPFRAPMPTRTHALLPYLETEDDQNLDIDIEVTLAPANCEPIKLSKTNSSYLYYSPAQMLAHHASSGAPICVGDLIGSGTISGPSKGSLGSLLEITRNGKEPFKLSNGELRSFLEDGDRISFSGSCSGAYQIGFGTCEGTVLSAIPY